MIPNDLCGDCLHYKKSHKPISSDGIMIDYYSCEDCHRKFTKNWKPCHQFRPMTNLEYLEYKYEQL
jgi:hypothetical protein